MLDKNKIKEKLEKERNLLVSELSEIAKLNAETGEWEAVMDEEPKSDQGDMADMAEEFELKTSTMRTLESRLHDILDALKNLNRESFGKCNVCKKNIEKERLEANLAAATCVQHLEY